MILMDEPTNHLDAESVAWLQNYLSNFPGCVILVTHDRYFLDQITTWILELDRGQGIPYEGNYSVWLEKKAKRIAQESREEAGRQKSLNRELEWVKASPKARQAKSKARMNAYEEKAAAAEREKITTAQIRIPPGPRLGSVVIEAEHLNKAFGDKLLMEDLSFKLPPGGIVGVIGPNGAGKTTLFKMITGREQPDGGTFKVGETVKLGYIDQSRDSLERQEHRLAGNLRRPRHHGGRRHRTAEPRLCRRLQLQGLATSRRKSASSRAVNATASTSPRC